jgi:hypothetical protein
VAAEAFLASEPHTDDVVLVLLTESCEVVLPESYFHLETQIERQWYVDPGPSAFCKGDGVLWFVPRTFEGIPVPAMLLFKKQYVTEIKNDLNYQKTFADRYVHWIRGDRDGGKAVDCVV